MRKVQPEYKDDSLLITHELIADCQGCREGVQFFSKVLPNGFTVKQVAAKEVRHIPMEYICWGYHYLPFTKNDKQLALDYAKIINSKGFFMSHHIENCNHISDSNNCKNSEYIANSQDVVNSKHIFYSQDVQNSSAVNRSEMIYDSEFCSHSEKVVDGKCITRSKNIKSSVAIDHSENVENCMFVRESTGLRSCIFCVDMNNAERRILCNANCPQEFEYAILNKEVSQSVFVRIFRQLQELLGDLEYHFFKLEELKGMNSTPAISAWIKTLQNSWIDIIDILPSMSKEDSELAYQITLLPEILKNKI